MTEIIKIKTTNFRFNFATNILLVVPIRTDSLVAILTNILKRIIVDQPMLYLVHNNIVLDTQHGFVPRRSVASNLLLVTKYYKLSTSFPVTSGVLQGTVIDPILFLIYIADLIIKILSDHHTHADDVKLYGKINQRSSLQHDLNTIAGISRYQE